MFCNPTIKPTAIALSCALSAFVAVTSAGPLAAQEVMQAKFNADGEVMRPDGWRSWIYVGTPLTPNALNDGEAPFPEFQSYGGIWVMA